MFVVLHFGEDKVEKIELWENTGNLRITTVTFQKIFIKKSITSKFILQRYLKDISYLKKFNSLFNGCKS